jgi:hypothetical protein
VSCCWSAAPWRQAARGSADRDAEQAGGAGLRGLGLPVDPGRAAVHLRLDDHADVEDAIRLLPVGAWNLTFIAGAGVGWSVVL